MKALDVAMIGVCAAVYVVIGRMTDLGVTVGGVAFWPAAVIPAVFAVLFGPWTGGIGAAIGIFIRDMVFHGDPLLSLSAGVTSNFVAFFLTGYIARSTLSWRKISLGAFISCAIIAFGLLLPTIWLPAESVAFTHLSSLESAVLFLMAVVVSILALITVTKLWPEYKNYVVGSIVGLGIGAAIVASVVWAYSQVFFSPTAYFKDPISSSFILIIYVWTFATEIPFVLVLGPVILKACEKALPSLKSSDDPQAREE